MLSRLALRLITVRALTGATWAGGRVADSAIPPIETLAAEAFGGSPQPFIAVYTDDVKYDVAGRDALTARGVVTLLIEIGATAEMRIALEDGSIATDPNALPPTDGGIECALDMIERQAHALLTADPGPWPELWRRFALVVRSRSSERGASFKDGVRFAGRQIVMNVETPADPTPGAPLPPLWSGLFDLMDAEPALATISAGMRAAATAPGAMLDWQRVRGQFGLTLDEARALQIAPPAGAEASAPDFALPDPLPDATIGHGT